MTEFLIKRFVNNHEQTEAPEVRTSYGLMASVVGIGCNLLLFTAKLLIGWFAHSISIVADAFNNLSDAASSIISFAGVKMAAKPADANHPFGHGRIEYISAFIVAFIVIQVGFSLFKTSVGKVLHPEEMVFNVGSVLILTLSVGVKLWMSVFNRNIGRRIHSAVLKATAADSLGDVGATSATIVSMLVFGFWQMNIDGIIGLIVSVLVMIAGVNIAKDTLAPLIGQAIDPEVYTHITDFVESYSGIVGSHDLIVHNYGPGCSMASIHAEVPNDVDVEVSHEIVDRIEHEANQKLSIYLVIHMDPVETKDQKVQELKAMATEVIGKLDTRLTLHDFRVVDGVKRINLIFDLVVTRDYTKPMQDALKQQVCQKIKERDERYACIITVECSYRVET